MNIKYFLIIFSLFSSIVSIQDNQKYELEMDTSKKFFLNNMTSDKTLYIFSKNSISGVYVYDINSPVPLNLSYGKSDNQELPSSFEEGHNENITQWKIKEGYQYFFSFPNQVSDDNKYSFIKIRCSNESNCLSNTENINVELYASYTWKISLFVLFYFLILIAAIFSTCYFARNCVTKCCNFTENS